MIFFRFVWHTTWATTWQNQQNDCALSEDSDQPGHPPSLIRVFAVRSIGSEGPKLFSCVQRRLPVFAGRTLILLVLSCRDSHVNDNNQNTSCGIMSSVWGMILQWGSTIKVSIELPVATRHRRGMTENLLKATFKQKKQTPIITEPPRDKTNKMTFRQQRLRSAWAFAQCDQSPHCALNG